MRASVLQCVALLLVVAAAAASAERLTTKALTPTVFLPRVGTTDHCTAQGRQYGIKYSVVAPHDDSFIDLDVLPGLKDVRCNRDRSAALLEFATEQAMESFLAALKFADSFVSGGERFGCDMAANQTAGVMLRRVISADYAFPSVELALAPVRYDELLQDAEISMHPTGACHPQAVARASLDEDKNFCIGVNTDATCQGAKQSIPIYSNSFMSLDCSECYLGFDTDVFLELKIRWFKLENLAGGFKNTQVDGSLIFDLNAQKSWSAGVDRTVSIVPQANIINFHIGPIPFRVWFSIPLEIRGSAQFNTHAEVKVGATAQWLLGDNYVSWDRTNHWQHVHSEPTMTWTPQLSASATMDITANFALVPSLIMHVDNLYTYQLQVTPQLNAEVTAAAGTGQDNELCANLSYEVELQSEAELQVNIPWIHFHEDDKFGPKVIYDSGVKPIASKCIKF